MRKKWQGLYSRCRSDWSIYGLRHKVFDMWQQEGRSQYGSLTRKNHWWLGPSLRVSGADPCSFQSEIIGGLRNAGPKV
ncbi:hypothetical protein TNCV_2296071 [Trichonephila clavipes]|nr:hypothetical protein TNCV_2296071 [Trichonephila clavipes]